MDFRKSLKLYLSHEDLELIRFWGASGNIWQHFKDFWGSSIFGVFHNLNLRSPGRDIELLSWHRDSKSSHKIESRYHKILSCSHKLASRYHKIESRSHKLASHYHKILTHSHKLAKSLPQDTNSFPQVSQVITTRY